MREGVRYHLMTATSIHNIGIAILHRNQLFRESLSCCLAQIDSFSVEHDASNSEEIEEALRAHNVDVLLLEFGILARGEERTTTRIRNLSSRVKTLVIDVPENENDVLYCIETGGASGYLLHNASIKDLMNNIKAVMSGETLCSPRVASLAFDRVSALTRQIESGHVVDGARLTRRETQIVGLIDEGLSNKEIAVCLHIGVSTVKNHVHNILDKLQLHNRHSAVKHIKEQAMYTGR